MARPEARVRGVNPNQCKDKICYYHSFKTQLGGQPKQDLGQRLEEST